MVKQYVRGSRRRGSGIGSDQSVGSEKGFQSFILKSRVKERANAAGDEFRIKAGAVHDCK